MKTNYMNLAILTFFSPTSGDWKNLQNYLFFKFQISNFLFLFGEIFAGKKKRAGSESVMHIMLSKVFSHHIHVDVDFVTMFSHV